MFPELLSLISSLPATGCEEVPHGCADDAEEAKLSIRVDDLCVGLCLGFVLPGEGLSGAVADTPLIEQHKRQKSSQAEGMSVSKEGMSSTK
jgi:hypothetical protein